MKIIVGLGNPGVRYERTRHNIGWLVLDAIAERIRAEFQSGKGDYYFAAGSWRGRKLTLVKPTTYMNNSGLAVTQLRKHFGVTADDMLVLVDEIQFPVGQIKLKPAGSSGGHNGIESVIYHLGDDRIARLRCGVGNDFGPGGMVDYVLSEFTAEESDALAEMIEEAKEAVLLWAHMGTARAMNQINARKPKSREEQEIDGTSSHKREAAADSSNEESEGGQDISTKR